MSFRRLAARAPGFGRVWLALAVATILSSTTAYAQLAGARPWLGVAFDSGAGSGASNTEIRHVVRGSPADRAGMRAGDKILRIGTTRVANGGEVVRSVATHAAGEVVDVVFARAAAEQTARVTLGVLPSRDDVIKMDLVGAFAPQLHDVAGVHGAFPASLSDLRGRVVVLDFWATWCAPCRIVTPKLGALQSRYGAQGLSVLGVSTEDAQEVALFADRTAMGYSVGVDTHGDTTRSYGVANLPTLVVIDKRGVVRDVSIGYDPGEDARLEQSVRALLVEPAPAD